MQKGDNCIFENSKDGWGITYRSKDVTCVKCIHFPALPINLTVYGLSLLYQLGLLLSAKYDAAMPTEAQAGLHFLTPSYRQMSSGVPAATHHYTTEVHYIPAEYWQSFHFLRLPQLNVITSDSYDCTTVHLYNCTTVQLSLSYFLLQALSISSSANSAVFAPRT